MEYNNDPYPRVHSDANDLDAYASMAVGYRHRSGMAVHAMGRAVTQENAWQEPADEMRSSMNAIAAYSAADQTARKRMHTLTAIKRLLFILVMAVVALTASVTTNTVLAYVVHRTPTAVRLVPARVACVVYVRKC